MYVGVLGESRPDSLALGVRLRGLYQALIHIGSWMELYRSSAGLCSIGRLGVVDLLCLI